MVEVTWVGGAGFEGRGGEAMPAHSLTSSALVHAS